MNKNEKELLKRMFEINTFVINNLNEDNIHEFLLILTDIENKLKNIKKVEKIEDITPIWMKFSEMDEIDIIVEFNNINKYPDLESIKNAVKGYLQLSKVSKVKTRKTLIKHILETYRRGEFISKIGKDEKYNESKKRV